MTPRRTIALRERAGWMLVLAGLALALVYSDWLWRLDQVFYDTQLKLGTRPAPDDIVIIAIDETSLRRYGRWPWSRDLHAQLLDRLHAEQPRAVAMDIIFAEANPADPRSDQQLARAIAHNGRVVLPILMEQERSTGQPSESLPLPMFAEAAAALGHVHVELDRDSIARSVYLHEGLGQPFWPHLSLATLAVAGSAPAFATDTDTQTSPMVWTRAHAMRIPYAGPPGHFKRMSYAQVLDGQYTPGTFRDKYVFVGTTAAGVGDALPTPMSGYSRVMPGVEINANILHALRQDLRIEPMPQTLLLLLSAALSALPALIYPLLAPRATLLAASGLTLLTLVISSSLLWFAHIWFPPAAAFTALLLSYPLWSWRRLELAMRYLNHALDELTQQRQGLAIGTSLQLKPALRFIGDVLPVDGWLLSDARGQVLQHDGNIPRDLQTATTDSLHWQRQDSTLSRLIETDTGTQTLSLNWLGEDAPSEQEYALLNDLVEAMNKPVKDRLVITSSEVLQTRIEQVQDATRQLQELRNFVDNSLSNMSDGMLVTDTLGQVILANARAAWYLRGDDNATLAGASLTDLFNELHIRDGGHWVEQLKIALLQQTRVQATARHRNGRDLLMQIAPLTPNSNHTRGLVVNLSDISPLTASERKRDELLNFLSHDLRSPLVSLLALIDLAGTRNSVEEIRAQMQRMQNYTEKTLNLAEQFLQLARAEGSLELPFHDVDLVTIAINACEQVWAQAQRHSITIEQQFDVEEAWVEGDGNLLERALVNLLTNAIKFSHTRAIVKVTLQRIGDCFECCVSDTGPGIPAAELPHLFDRFWHVHRRSNRGQDGAGLGLAFVDAAIRKHGGSVEVQSVVNRGSRFCISLHAAE